MMSGSKNVHLILGKKIKEFSEDIFTEITGIATGSDQPLYLIIVLNSRSEIMTYRKDQESPFSEKVSECTSLYYVNEFILAQTWDWFQNIQHLPVLFSIQKNTHPYTILTFTEPGIVAKLGMSTSGVAVGLNFLITETACTGVPVHVVIRSLLESPSLHEWKIKHAKFLEKPGISAAVTVGTNITGIFSLFEFYHDCSCEVEPQSSLKGGKVYCRANHYLHPKITDILMNSSESYPASIDRQNSALLLLKEMENYDSDTISISKYILQNPKVNRAFSPNRHFPHLNSGTVAVVIMDLRKMEFHVTAHENPRENMFKVIKLY